MELLSKKEAKKLGKTYFFTGKKCQRGHLSKRYVSSGACSSCAAENKKIRRSDPVKLKREREQERSRRNPSYRVTSQTFSVPKGIDEKERKRIYARLYYQHNKEKIKLKTIERMKRNPSLVEERRAYQTLWQKKFRKTPEGAAISFMRKCIARMVSNKNKRSEDILGYSREDFIQHIQKQFQYWMTWDNYGEWHIDHIVPISFFIKNGIYDPKKINCLTNLRPICAKENLSKHARITRLI